MHLTRTFRWPERYNPRDISPSSTHLLIHSFIPPIFEQLFYVRLGLANGNKTQFLLIRKRPMSGVSLEDPMNKRKGEGRNYQLSIFRWSREHYSTLCPKDLYAVLEWNVSLKFFRGLRESKVRRWNATTNWGGGGVGGVRKRDLSNSLKGW